MFRRRKQLTLVAVALGLGVLALKITTIGELDLQKFAEHQPINDSWNASKKTLPPDSDQPLQERFVYSVVNRARQEVELSRLAFDDLTFAYFERNGKKFLLTGYFGSGSSDAYYYRLYSLRSDMVTPVAARVSYSAYSSSEDCLDSSKKVEQEEPIFEFADCGTPTIVDNELIFETPGWHCGFFEVGGCPRRDVVSLR